MRGREKGNYSPKSNKTTIILSMVANRQRQLMTKRADTVRIPCGYRAGTVRVPCRHCTVGLCACGSALLHSIYRLTFLFFLKMVQLYCNYLQTGCKESVILEQECRQPRVLALCKRVRAGTWSSSHRGWVSECNHIRCVNLH